MSNESLQLICGTHRSELTLEYDPAERRGTAWLMDRTGPITECRQAPLSVRDIRLVRDWCDCMLAKQRSLDELGKRVDECGAAVSRDRARLGGVTA